MFFFILLMLFFIFAKFLVYLVSNVIVKKAISNEQYLHRNLLIFTFSLLIFVYLDTNENILLHTVLFIERYQKCGEILYVSAEIQSFTWYTIAKYWKVATIEIPNAETNLIVVMSYQSCLYKTS